MGCDDDSDLAFFPAMGKPAEPKVELVSWMIAEMSKHYDVRPMKDHAASLCPPVSADPRGVRANLNTQVVANNDV